MNWTSIQSSNVFPVSHRTNCNKYTKQGNQGEKMCEHSALGITGVSHFNRVILSTDIITLVTKMSHWVTVHNDEKVHIYILAVPNTEHVEQQDAAAVLAWIYDVCTGSHKTSAVALRAETTADGLRDWRAGKSLNFFSNHLLFKSFQSQLNPDVYTFLTFFPPYVCVVQTSNTSTGRKSICFVFSWYVSAVQFTQYTC